MNETMGESLSALMDGAAGELELQRILAQVSADDELRRTWIRYHLAQHAAHGHPLAYLNRDVSQRVHSALAGLPAARSASIRQRLLRPLASLAVAASVTVTVVIGGQKLAQLGGAEPYGLDQSVATSASPVGMLNSLGAGAVQASYGAQRVPFMQAANSSVYQELARERLRKYMQEHAEQVALNSPEGLVPFARVPQLRE